MPTETFGWRGDVCAALAVADDDDPVCSWVSAPRDLVPAASRFPGGLAYTGFCRDFGVVQPAHPLSLGGARLPDAASVAGRPTRRSDGPRFREARSCRVGDDDPGRGDRDRRQIQFDWLGRSLSEIIGSEPTVKGLGRTSVRDKLRTRGMFAPGALVATMNWRGCGNFGYMLGADATILVLGDDSRQFGFAHPVGSFIGRDLLVLSEVPTAPTIRWFRSVRILPDGVVRLDGRVVWRVITVE